MILFLVNDMRVMKIDRAFTRNARIEEALRNAMRSRYDCIWFYGFSETDIKDFKNRILNSGLRYHSGNRPPPIPSTFRTKQVIDEINLL